MGDFVRKLPGVNSNRIKADLMDLGYLYRKQAGVYKVRSAFRDKLFAEQFDEKYGNSAITVLDKGKRELVKLYNEGRLTSIIMP